METGTKVESSGVRATALSLLIVDDEVTTRTLCNEVALEAGLSWEDIAKLKESGVIG